MRAPRAPRVQIRRRQTAARADLAGGQPEPSTTSNKLFGGHQLSPNSTTTATLEPIPEETEFEIQCESDTNFAFVNLLT